MTQATTHPQGKKFRHKDLKQPDEFISLSNRAIAWAQKNQATVLAAVGVAVAVVLVVGGLALTRTRGRVVAVAVVAVGSAVVGGVAAIAPVAGAVGAALAEEAGGAALASWAALGGALALATGRADFAVATLPEEAGGILRT